MTAQTADALAGTVINNTGIVQARTIQSKNGVIILDGGTNGTVNVDGTLDASAPNDGDGGFVETSGAHVKINDNAHITTLAIQGANGTWLIDPDGFTIAASGGDMTGAVLSSGLAGGNVNIVSTNGSGSDGNNNVNDAVTWSANKLTLTATHDINVNAVMTARDTASLDLEPGSGNVNKGLTESGFSGRVNFIQANGTPRRGTGFLTINGHDYTDITSLGIENSTSGIDLQGINGGLGDYYALGSDIDATATQTWNNDGSGNFKGFVPIGTNSTYFTGTFDGLGHTISNLYINRTDTDYVGLFGYATGTIRNVAITSDSVHGISGNNYVGGLVGYHSSGLIANCSVSNTIVTGVGNNVGGLVGNNHTQSNVGSYGTVNVNSTVSNCYWLDMVALSGFGSCSGTNSTALTNAEMKQSANFNGWDIAIDGGDSTVWRIYEGYSYPLLASFLTDLSVSADSYVKTYDGLSYTPTNATYTAADGSIVDHGLILGSLNFGNNAIHVGSYTLEGLYCTSQNGYDIRYDSNSALTINKRTLTLTANGENKVYDGTTAATVSFSDNRIAGDALTINGTAVFSDKNVGVGKTVRVDGTTVIGADAGNYTWNTTASTTADITQAALTITANNCSRFVGMPNPIFTVTCSGFVNGRFSGLPGWNSQLYHGGDNSFAGRKVYYYTIRREFDQLRDYLCGWCVVGSIFEPDAQCHRCRRSDDVSMAGLVRKLWQRIAGPIMGCCREWR